MKTPTEPLNPFTLPYGSAYKLDCLFHLSPNLLRIVVWQRTSPSPKRMSFVRLPCRNPADNTIAPPELQTSYEAINLPAALSVGLQTLVSSPSDTPFHLLPLSLVIDYPGHLSVHTHLA
jgi:hypothetical protein